MSKPEREFVNQYDRSKIDAVAEREGAAVLHQQLLGNMKTKGGRKKPKSLEDYQLERATSSLPRVLPERDRNSFRKTGI